MGAVLAQELLRGHAHQGGGHCHVAVVVDGALHVLQVGEAGQAVGRPRRADHPLVLTAAQERVPAQVEVRRY